MGLRGGKKRDREERKPSEPPKKRPCREKERGQESGKDKRKRERSVSSINRPEKRFKECVSREGEEPRPGPSTQSRPVRRCTNIRKRFNFISVIGQGSFGRVSKAIDKTTNKVMAIKEVLKESSTPEESLHLENRILQLAAESPFLMHSQLSLETAKQWYFVMEFASGDLHRHLKKHGPLPTDSAAFYAAEITSGLQFLHAKGFIHRDLKPENILMDNSGHLKIADFGLALNQTEGITQYAGTPGYVAPEVLAGQTYNLAADYFSLGVIIFQLTTGRPSSRCNIANLQKYHLTAETEQIIKELLCKDPRKRLGTNGCIRSHPFFQAINWKDLEELKITPPYIPSK
ncbi:protein kinase C delta type-like [Eleutherodactylus coqui]|uniref:protein kinase C delta type-like n=1 Tax=Eleutherodactylus coqui TaxID=57060 RepID=UPI003461BC94